MKRFIRYLYEYENEKRIRNVGFVKVEAGDEETVVHMQAKGFRDGEDRRLVLYLFYKENRNVVRVRQTETRLTSPVLSEHLSCVRYEIEGSDAEKIYDKICGVLIETGSGRRIAATWDDKTVDVSQVKEYEPRVQEEFEMQDEPKRSIEFEYEKEKAEGDALESESGAPQEEKHLFPRRKNTTKIQLQDISRLPRCEWKLVNNQFLIHGYNNYHHLLLIEEGNYLKLGVPGIYHIKEAKCAEMFGFEEFFSVEELGIRDMENDIEDNMKPDSQQEVFGYWCRLVRRWRS